MDAEQIKALIEAIKNQDGAAALAIAEAMLVSAASGEAAASADPAADPLASAADPAAEDPNKPGEMASLTARLNKLEAEKAESVKKLSARVAELETEKATTERAERVVLVAELVKLGFETPALAWEGEPEKQKPCKRLQNEPVAELRERVKTLSALRPERITPPTLKDETTAAGGRSITTAHGVVTLSASEIKNCEESGAKLEAYAENKAIRESARTKVQK